MPASTDGACPSGGPDVDTSVPGCTPAENACETSGWAHNMRFCLGLRYFLGCTSRWERPMHGPVLGLALSTTSAMVDCCLVQT